MLLESVIVLCKVICLIGYWLLIRFRIFLCSTFVLFRLSNQLFFLLLKLLMINSDWFRNQTIIEIRYLSFNRLKTLIKAFIICKHISAIKFTIIYIEKFSKSNYKKLHYKDLSKSLRKIISLELEKCKFLEPLG